MAFGKRSASDPAASRIAAQDEDAAIPDNTLLSAPGIGAVRTRVANHGDIDRNFMILAAGVVVLAAGAAFAAPALFSAITGGNVRPIEEVVAGLDRQGARAALAKEAFPDPDGRALMNSLAANFPHEHARLLDTLTDRAMAGGDRDDLYLSLGGWITDFAPGQFPALARTGSRGFDAGVQMIDEALVFIDKDIGACTPAKATRLMSDPNAFARFSSYGSGAYTLSVRATTRLVDLAAAGRSLPAVDTRLTANDMNALQSTFFSMMGDSQVMMLMQAGMSARAGGGFDQSEAFNNIDYCRLAHTVLLKLKTLPDGTKARLFGTMMSQDFARNYGPGAFSGPSGGPSFNMLLNN